MNLEKNRQHWGEGYTWKEEGEEWSRAWGGAAMQWHGGLLRRIFPFLPARHLLEIAPGQGRWTQFLLTHCEKYTGIEIAQRCVEHCSRRFAGATHASFHLTDGVTMPAAANSVDFVFSFDSLVHADRATIEGYLKELARVLTADGVAFIHHSNLAAVDSTWVPAKDSHLRDSSVSAAWARVTAEAVGLCCAAQEISTWGREDPYPIDCVSLLTRPGSRWARPTVTLHTDLWLERALVRKLAAAYGPASFSTDPAVRERARP